jgi:hypothetical protein
MRLAPDPASLPTGRGRRALIALLILLLVLLPLYLWPLRGGISGLRGASAVSGVPGDPRNPAAVAGIPSDVWDALLERGAGGGPTGAPKRPRNLTMITEHQIGTGPGGVDVDSPPSFHAGWLTPHRAVQRRPVERRGLHARSVLHGSIGRQNWERLASVWFWRISGSSVPRSVEWRRAGSRWRAARRESRSHFRSWRWCAHANSGAGDDRADRLECGAARCSCVAAPSPQTGDRS